MKTKLNYSWQWKNELQGILLIGFSLVIFKLYVTDNITILVERKMIPYILLSMFSLFIIGFFRLWNSDMTGADCDCEACDMSSSSTMSFIKYMFFLVPIVLSLLLNDFSVNSEVLSKKGLENTGANESVLQERLVSDKWQEK
ncbi:MAG TPA: DUF1980 domain-containing protein [Chondromyces sp.]|nr:DUF1980 domain-containing protein [Chondromyces sp.]